MASKSDKNGDDEKAYSSDEVTAEWVVRAQLKISQPKKKAASFGTGDCGARRSSGSPCRVVYKWNSDLKSQDRSTASLRNVRNSSEKVSQKLLSSVHDPSRKTARTENVFISRLRKVDQKRPHKLSKKMMRVIRPATAPAVLF